MFVRENVKMSEASISYLVTLYGVIMYTGGRFIVPRLIASLGQRGFTSLANLAVGCSWAFMGLAMTEWAQFAGFFALFPGINANSSSALRAMATDRAVAEGFGRCVL